MSRGGQCALCPTVAVCRARRDVPAGTEGPSPSVSSEDGTTVWRGVVDPGAGEVRLDVDVSLEGVRTACSAWFWSIAKSSMVLGF